MSVSWRLHTFIKSMAVAFNQVILPTRYSCRSTANHFGTECGFCTLINDVLSESQDFIDESRTRVNLETINHGVSEKWCCIFLNLVFLSIFILFWNKIILLKI